MELKKHKNFTAVYAKDQPINYVRAAVDPVQYDAYRAEWAKTESLELIPDFPLQLDFELNYSCNFTCINCTWNIESTAGKGKDTWFPFEVFCKIIDDAVPKGLKSVRLNYINEPLMRKDIVKFIEYARNAGVLDIYFSTNGSLLTEKVSRELIKAGLLRLQVSIDAATKPTFDKIRQGGDFDVIHKNIADFLRVREELGAHLPTIRVNFVKTSDNEHELDDFIAQWQDKVDGIGIQDLVAIMNIDESSTVEERKAFKCVQPFNHLTIRYDGEILPCCSFFGAETPIAMLKSPVQLSTVDNVGLRIKETKELIKTRTIEETWNSEEIKFLREIHTKGEYWRHPVCKRCVEATSHKDETQ
jgi:MoaA/NifB/PqqE/SkfB family radical SAM enzyme